MEKHLEFIQNVITRMNTNSFLIKGWMVTLVSALFALAAKDTDARYAMITFFAVPVFWGLDAFYLAQERKYRSLYDAVRRGAVDRFAMDASGFKQCRNRWFCTLFSISLLLLYVGVIAAAVIVTIMMRHPYTR